MRVAPAIELSSVARLELEKLSRRRTTPVRVAQRSRIILLAADGLQDKQIAERIDVAPRMAALWRSRFIELGCRGSDEGCAPRRADAGDSAAMAAQVIAKTTQSKPAGATHWSRSTMAREMGISESSVGRIWRAHGLKPHRVESFKVSNDPQFAEKLEAIVGLYLNPPEHALVLSVDEKSQIQALDRTQPGLPHEEGPRPDHDPRLQTQRHNHPVRRPRHRHRRSLWALPAAASPSGVASVPAHDRRDHARRQSRST